jgi:hypothetical protein
VETLATPAVRPRPCPACLYDDIFFNSRALPLRIPKPKPDSPNALTGELTSANAIVTPPPDGSTTGTCEIANSQGSAVSDCLVDYSDPTAPFVIASISCPEGQIALQNGCVSTGPEAITGVTQQLSSVDTVQCIVNLPTTGSYAVTVTATCVVMSINSPAGALLKSSLSLQSTRARVIGARR